MYRFYNPKSSSVRSIMIANCIDSPTNSNANLCKEACAGPSSRIRNVAGSSPGRNNNNNNSYGTRTGNPPSNLCYERDLHLVYPFTSNYLNRRPSLEGVFQNWKPMDNVADIDYTAEFRASTAVNLQRRKDALMNQCEENSRGESCKTKRQNSDSSDGDDGEAESSRASRSSSSEVSSPFEGTSREGSPSKKISLTKRHKLDECKSSNIFQQYLFVGCKYNWRRQQNFTNRYYYVFYSKFKILLIM